MALPAEIQRKVRGIENLATLPNIAAEILEKVRNSGSSMREISRIVEKDASITTKIIKVSNSPLWGYPGRIDNVQRALIVLGLKQVTNIVLAVSLYSAFLKLKPNPYFDRERFWLHSASTGQIARALSAKLHLQFHGEEFLAALIHDIGKLILDQFFGDTFLEILETAEKTGKTCYEVEMEILGCSHGEIGAELLKRWKFPQSIIEAVNYHHHPQKANGYAALSSIINLSDNLCELWGVGFNENIKRISIPESPAWRILKSQNSQMENLDIEKFTFELQDEVEKAQLFLQLI